nr:immunoglobulin heavy chain junction region [Macaca mulatta]MOX58583.1 immunoglobulin heavy chain junction region [Macaca mulatta]MOX58644.1 immunoglobulin heavy chain junction region [Macaca mulatta]MOX58755.1 immunoglobulin heavy chain junction region [Macaca mulatta]MOX58989.1 immunoglobulin heavy chain junction region [Macaca mulatta]
CARVVGGAAGYFDFW